MSSNSLRRPRKSVAFGRTRSGFVRDASQTDGFGLSGLDPLTTLRVRTGNTLYRITVLEPSAREVMVEGGSFFPEHTRARLDGSSFRGTGLKLGWVGIGLQMEFQFGSRRIRTSRVREVALESSSTLRPS